MGDGKAGRPKNNYFTESATQHENRSVENINSSLQQESHHIAEIDESQQVESRLLSDLKQRIEGIGPRKTPVVDSNLKSNTATM